MCQEIIKKNVVLLEICDNNPLIIVNYHTHHCTLVAKLEVLVDKSPY